MVVATDVRILSSGSQEVLKHFAFVTMVLGHTESLVFEESMPLMFFAGRLSAVIFCFLLVYNLAVHKMPVKKYILRLLPFAIISQPIYAAVLDIPLLLDLNILFTLLFTGIALSILQDVTDQTFGIKQIFLLVVAIAGLMHSNYGLTFLALAVSFWTFLRYPSLLAGSVVIAATYMLNGWYDHSVDAAYSLAALPIIVLAYRLPLELKRVHWAWFYTLYPLQFIQLAYWGG